MSSKTAVWAIVAALLLFGSSRAVQAESGRPIGPAMIVEYTTNCGDCHVPFRPELLPASGWAKIFSHLDEHFGKAVELSEENREGLFNYLQTYAADRSFTEIPRKIMKSLGDKTVERITDTPYILEKHDEIDPAVYERASIGKFSNCIACHKRTVEGIYDDDKAVIPE